MGSKCSCLDNLIKKYISLNKLTDSIVLTNSILNLTLPVVVQSPPYDLAFKYRRVDVYVLELDAEDLEFWLRNDRQHFNPRALFVLLMDNFSNTLLPLFVKHHVYKVLLIFNLQIFGFNPYVFENVYEEDLSWSKIGSCNSVSFFDVSFVGHLPKTWRNTTMKMLVKEVTPFSFISNNLITGFEYDIYKTVQQRLGFKIKTTKQTDKLWGERLPNGSFDEGLGRLQSHQHDVVIGAYSNMDDYFMDFDMSYVYISKKVTWIVPTAKLLGFEVRIYHILSWQVWLVFILAAVASVLVYKIMGLNVCAMTFSVFASLVGSTIKLRKTTLSFRALMGAWLYFCLIISTMFRNEMVYMFSSVQYAHEINTKEDLFVSEMDLVVIPYIATYCAQHNDPRYRQFIKRAVVNDNPNIMWDLVAYEGHISNVYKLVAESIIARRYLDNNGMPLIHIVEEKLFETYTSLVMVKGYPMYEQINRLILLLMDNGFIWERIKFYTDYANKLRSKAKVLKKHTLGYEQLKFVFGLWVESLFISILVFICEIFYYKWSTRISL
ncbi:uncharacterized protein LOC126265691 [Aethina tumida]|uniref:uncharacterized protein LOC126265691 n=1 Tax=Aethina tumida TaxID=116153 RepID=UPI002148AF76|nr:uncharacterized protein LOC126265691 [Aethina tumida]